MKVFIVACSIILIFSIAISDKDKLFKEKCAEIGSLFGGYEFNRTKDDQCFCAFPLKDKNYDGIVWFKECK